MSLSSLNRIYILKQFAKCSLSCRKISSNNILFNKWASRSFSSIDSSHNSALKWKLLAGGALVVGIVTNASDAVGAISRERPSLAQLSEQLLLQQADDLYSQGLFEELYTLLEPHKDDDNDAVLWRLARACYERAKTAPAGTGAVDRGTLLKEAFSYAQRGLALNDKNFAVHKWMAILVDEVAALDGSKSRIKQSFVMKEHMEKACELNPTDGTSWYLLGMWHYNIADIPWYQRQAAAILFATPPQSTFEEALQMFLHAEEVEPNFYSQNLLMVGRCYHRLQDREAAVRYWRLARDYKQNNPTKDDTDAAQQATELLHAAGCKE